MNTNKLQSFAAEARTSLMKAVRLALMPHWSRILWLSPTARVHTGN